MNPQLQLRQRTCQTSSSCCSGSISADRSSESLTRTQSVPAQDVGFSVQWGHALGTRQHLVAGLEESERTTVKPMSKVTSAATPPPRQRAEAGK